MPRIHEFWIPPKANLFFFGFRWPSIALETGLSLAGIHFGVFSRLHQKVEGICDIFRLFFREEEGGEVLEMVIFVTHLPIKISRKSLMLNVSSMWTSLQAFSILTLWFFGSLQGSSADFFSWLFGQRNDCIKTGTQGVPWWNLNAVSLVAAFKWFVVDQILCCLIFLRCCNLNEKHIHTSHTTIGSSSTNYIIAL